MAIVAKVSVVAFGPLVFLIHALLNTLQFWSLLLLAVSKSIDILSCIVSKIGKKWRHTFCLLPLCVTF